MQARLPEEPQLPEPDSPERGQIGEDPQDPPEADPFGLDALVPEQKKYGCPPTFTVTIADIYCISPKQEELAARVVTLTTTWVHVVFCCPKFLIVATEVWLCCVLPCYSWSHHICVVVAQSPQVVPARHSKVQAQTRRSCTGTQS